MDSCALILLEPRLLRPKYMQRGDSAPPKNLYSVHPRDKRALLENAAARRLLEVYLRRTTGGFPSPVGPAIGDVLLLWTRQ